MVAPRQLDRPRAVRLVGSSDARAPILGPAHCAMGIRAQHMCWCWFFCMASACSLVESALACASAEEPPPQVAWQSAHKYTHAHHHVCCHGSANSLRCPGNESNCRTPQLPRGGVVPQPMRPVVVSWRQASRLPDRASMGPSWWLAETAYYTRLVERGCANRVVKLARSRVFASVRRAASSTQQASCVRDLPLDAGSPRVPDRIGGGGARLVLWAVRVVPTSLCHSDHRFLGLHCAACWLGNLGSCQADSPCVATF